MFLSIVNADNTTVWKIIVTFFTYSSFPDVLPHNISKWQVKWLVDISCLTSVNKSYEFTLFNVIFWQCFIIDASQLLLEILTNFHISHNFIILFNVFINYICMGLLIKQCLKIKSLAFTSRQRSFPWQRLLYGQQESHKKGVTPPQNLIDFEALTASYASSRFFFKKGAFKFSYQYSCKSYNLERNK